MGSVNPAVTGWGWINVSASTTLGWSHHGMTLGIVAAVDDPVEITFPKLADFDKFWVRLVQLSRIPKLLTTATGGVYDKFLMPNMPGATEKLEPVGRSGIAYARVEIFGRAGEGWLIVGGDGTWQDVDTPANVYPLGGNLVGTEDDLVTFDVNGKIKDSGVLSTGLVTTSNAMTSGSGAPIGTGFAGQWYRDTDNGDLYANVDGSTTWVKVYDAP